MFYMWRRLTHEITNLTISQAINFKLQCIVILMPVVLIAVLWWPSKLSISCFEIQDRGKAELYSARICKLNFTKYLWKKAKVLLVPQIILSCTQQIFMFSVLTMMITVWMNYQKRRNSIHHYFKSYLKTFYLCKGRVGIKASVFSVWWLKSQYMVLLWGLKMIVHTTYEKKRVYIVIRRNHRYQLHEVNYGRKNIVRNIVT